MQQSLKYGCLIKNPEFCSDFKSEEKIKITAQQSKVIQKTYFCENFANFGNQKKLPLITFFGALFLFPYSISVYETHF